MNKKGKANTLLVVGVIAVLLILGYLVYANVQNTALGGNGGANTGNTGSITTTSSTLSFAGAEKYSPGTAVTSASYISVNGAPFSTGIAAVSPGAQLSILLVNNTSEHNVYIPAHTASGTNDVIPASFNKNGTLTLTTFNTNNQVITSGGGGTNQTGVTVGGAYTLTLRADPASQTSNQDMVMVVEANATALQPGQLGVIVNGGGASFIGTSKPTFYTPYNVNNGVWEFALPAISNGASATYTIQFVSASGKTLVGAGTTTGYGIITLYTKEYFLDSAMGTVQYDIQDSSGAKKSMNAPTQTVYFTA